jgi:hypothetical protein
MIVESFNTADFEFRSIRMCGLFISLCSQTNKHDRIHSIDHIISHNLSSFIIDTSSYSNMDIFNDDIDNQQALVWYVNDYLIIINNIHYIPNNNIEYTTIIFFLVQTHHSLQMMTRKMKFTVSL